MEVSHDGYESEDTIDARRLEQEAEIERLQKVVGLQSQKLARHVEELSDTHSRVEAAQFRHSLLSPATECHIALCKGIRVAKGELVAVSPLTAAPVPLAPLSLAESRELIFPDSSDDSE